MPKGATQRKDTRRQLTYLARCSSLFEVPYLNGTLIESLFVLLSVCQDAFSQERVEASS